MFALLATLIRISSALAEAIMMESKKAGVPKMKQELLKGLTEERIAQVNACNKLEEVLTVAKESGVELTDEQLEAVSGGDCFDTPVDVCPRCGHTGTIHGYRTDHTYGYSCSYCGFPLPKKKDVK